MTNRPVVHHVSTLRQVSKGIMEDTQRNEQKKEQDGTRSETKISARSRNASIGRMPEYMDGLLSRIDTTYAAHHPMREIVDFVRIDAHEEQ
jgi:hypothetical protein